MQCCVELIFKANAFGKLCLSVFTHFTKTAYGKGKKNHKGSATLCCIAFFCGMFFENVFACILTYCKPPSKNRKIVGSAMLR